MGDDWQIRRHHFVYAGYIYHSFVIESCSIACIDNDYAEHAERIFTLEISAHSASEGIFRAETGFRVVRLDYYTKEGVLHRGFDIGSHWQFILNAGERLILGGSESIPLTSEQVRVFAECALDESAWQMGLVQERPTIGDDYCPQGTYYGMTGQQPIGSSLAR